MEPRKLDSTSEYFRRCGYIECCDDFMADHMLRKYCPEKFGMKNYCKNRQKRYDDVFKQYSLNISKNPDKGKAPGTPALTQDTVLSNEKGENRLKEMADLFRNSAKNGTARVARADLERILKVQNLGGIIEIEGYRFRKVAYNSTEYHIE